MSIREMPLQVPCDLRVVSITANDAALVAWALKKGDGEGDDCVATFYRLQYQDNRSSKWYDGPFVVGGSTKALLGVCVSNQRTADEYLVRIKTMQQRYDRPLGDFKPTLLNVEDMNADELAHLMVKKENEKLFGEDIDHPDDPVSVGEPFEIQYSGTCSLQQSSFRDYSLNVSLSTANSAAAHAQKCYEFARAQEEVARNFEFVPAPIPKRSYIKSIDIHFSGSQSVKEKVQVEVKYTQEELTELNTGLIYNVEMKLLTQEEHIDALQYEQDRRHSLIGEPFHGGESVAQVTSSNLGDYATEKQEWVRSRSFKPREVGRIDVECSRICGFRVLATNRDGVFSISPMKMFYTANPPSAPRNLNSMATDFAEEVFENVDPDEDGISMYLWGRVQLTWNPPADFGGSAVVAYTVQFRRSEAILDDPLSEPTLWSKRTHLHDWESVRVPIERVCAPGQSMCTHVIERLGQWEEYDFRVAAVNGGAGQGGFSSPVRSTPQAALEALMDMSVKSLGKSTMRVSWNTPQDVVSGEEDFYLVFTGFFVEYRTIPATQAWKRQYFPMTVSRKRRMKHPEKPEYSVLVKNLVPAEEYMFRAAIAMRPMTELEREKAAGMAGDFFWENLNKKKVPETTDLEEKEESFPGPFTDIVTSRAKFSPAAPRDLRAARTGPQSLTIVWRVPKTDYGSAITGFTIRYRLADVPTWRQTDKIPVAAAAAKIGQRMTDRLLEKKHKWTRKASHDAHDKRASYRTPASSAVTHFHHILKDLKSLPELYSTSNAYCIRVAALNEHGTGDFSATAIYNPVKMAFDDAKAAAEVAHTAAKDSKRMTCDADEAIRQFYKRFNANRPQTQESERNVNKAQSHATAAAAVIQEIKQEIAKALDPTELIQIVTDADKALSNAASAVGRAKQEAAKVPNALSEPFAQAGVAKTKTALSKAVQASNKITELLALARATISGQYMTYAATVAHAAATAVITQVDAVLTEVEHVASPFEGFEIEDKTFGDQSTAPPSTADVYKNIEVKRYQSKARRTSQIHAGQNAPESSASALHTMRPFTPPVKKTLVARTAAIPYVPGAHTGIGVLARDKRPATSADQAAKVIIATRNPSRHRSPGEDSPTKHDQTILFINDGVAVGDHKAEIASDNNSIDPAVKEMLNTVKSSTWQRDPASTGGHAHTARTVRTARTAPAGGRTASAVAHRKDIIAAPAVSLQRAQSAVHRSARSLLPSSVSKSSWLLRSAPVVPDTRFVPTKPTLKTQRILSPKAKKKSDIAYQRLHLRSAKQIQAHSGRRVTPSVTKHVKLKKQDLGSTNPVTVEELCQAQLEGLPPVTSAPFWVLSRQKLTYRHPYNRTKEKEQPFLVRLASPRHQCTPAVKGSVTTNSLAITARRMNQFNHKITPAAALHPEISLSNLSVSCDRFGRDLGAVSTRQPL